MVAHTCNLSCAGEYYSRRIVTVRSAWATKKYLVFFFFLSKFLGKLGRVLGGTVLI